MSLTNSFKSIPMLIFICVLCMAIKVNAKILSVFTSLEETTNSAHLVVLGTVTSIERLENDLLAIIEIDSFLKGEAEGNKVKAFFYGPIPGGNHSSVDMELRALEFSVGEKCIVFLREKDPPDEYYQVVNHDHGKLEIIATEEGEMVKMPIHFTTPLNENLRGTESLGLVLDLIADYVRNPRVLLNPMDGPEEMINKMECTACHQIPGIPGVTKGTSGPILIGAVLAPRRVESEAYRAYFDAGKVRATEPKQYMMESIISHGAYVVSPFVSSDDSPKVRNISKLMTLKQLNTLADWLLEIDCKAAIESGLTGPPQEPVTEICY